MSGIAMCSAVTMLIAFSTAFLSKVRSATAFVEFSESLHQFGIRTVTGRRVLAAVVLAAEVAAGCVLVMPGNYSAAVRLGPCVALLVMFSTGVAVAGLHNPGFACHCFGSATPSRIVPHLAVNGAMVLLAVIAIASSPLLDPAGSMPTRVLAVGLGLIAGALVVTATATIDALFPIRRKSNEAKFARKA